MNRFISSKNTIVVTILWSLVIFMMLMMLFSYQKGETALFPVIVISLVSALLIWILLDTRYVIRNCNLLYRSGPFRGRISIEKIKNIQYYSGMNVPVNRKPALDTNGFIITYNEFDDVYVSPKEGDTFISELLKINPKIIIKR